MGFSRSGQPQLACGFLPDNGDPSRFHKGVQGRVYFCNVPGAFTRGKLSIGAKKTKKNDLAV